MSKNTRWSPEDLRKKNMIETKDGFVKADKLTTPAHKVKKIEPGTYRNDVMPRDTHTHSGTEPKANRKIKNATKTEVDGVKFDSRLEAYMYGLLKQHGIYFEFQVCYVLQDKFRYGKEAIRAMTLTVDFVLPWRNMIIDTKGFKNDVAPVKHKLLKYKLHKEGKFMRIEQPSNKQQCEELINEILSSMP